MIKYLKKEKIAPICACAGDTIILSYTDKKQKTIRVAEAEIKETTKINEARIFEFKNEFGLSKGFGGVFGKE